MKKVLLFLAAAALTVACASPEKMAKLADNVLVSCEPAVLEVVNGSIDPTVTVSYPKDYFNPKVILEVTPVIVYQGGEAAMEPLMYQGEKVKNNYKVVSSEGQKVSEKLHFNYVEDICDEFIRVIKSDLKGSKEILSVKPVYDCSLGKLADTLYYFKKEIESDRHLPIIHDEFELKF